MYRPALVAALSFTILGAAAASGVLFGGCSSGELDEVVFEGGTSTDALETMLETKLVDSPKDAAEFTWPTNGDVVELNPPPKFCWRQGAVEDARWAPPDVDLPFRVERPSPHRTVSFFDRWLGEGTAYADAGGFSGRGFLLVFSSSADPELIRVFTTLADYTPDAAKMKMLTSAKGTLKAVVNTAIFADGVITKTGGPFKGIPVTFTMAATSAQ